MRTLLSYLAIVALLFSSAVCAKDDEAFLIREKDFKKQVKVIALTPIDAPPVIGMTRSAELIIEEEITARLRKRGFEVIPAQTLADIRSTMTAQVTSDLDSGQIDAARAQAVREHSYREMMFRHPLDAIALVRVEIVNASFENDKARWHDTNQKVEHSGRGKFSGTIPASSVSVLIFDRNEELLYSHSGGLEVLMRREETQFVRLPEGSYFQDEKRIRKAAKESVAPL